MTCCKARQSGQTAFVNYKQQQEFNQLRLLCGCCRMVCMSEVQVQMSYQGSGVASMPYFLNSGTKGSQVSTFLPGRSVLPVMELARRCCVSLLAVVAALMSGARQQPQMHHQSIMCQ
jgi:hypothetical protein